MKLNAISIVIFNSTQERISYKLAYKFHFLNMIKNHTHILHDFEIKQISSTR